MIKRFSNPLSAKNIPLTKDLNAQNSKINETTNHPDSVSTQIVPYGISKFRQVLSQNTQDILRPNSSPWVCFAHREEVDKERNENDENTGLDGNSYEPSEGEIFDGGNGAIFTSGSSEGDEDREEPNDKNRCTGNSNLRWMDEPVAQSLISLSPVQSEDNDANAELRNARSAKFKRNLEKSQESPSIPHQSRPPRKERNSLPTRGRNQTDVSDSSSESEGTAKRRSRSQSLLRRQAGARNYGSNSSRSRSKSRPRYRSEQKPRVTRSHSAAPERECVNSSDVINPMVRSRRSRSCIRNKPTSSQSNSSNTANQLPSSPPLSPTTEKLSPTNYGASPVESTTTWSTPLCRETIDNSANIQLPESSTSVMSSTRVTTMAQVRTTAAKTTRLRSGLTEPNFLSQSSFESTNRISSTKFSSPHYNIHTRTLLTTSVYHNEATDIWITTINMNQNSRVTKSNAAKYLMAFSFATEREARESAYANAPPKMLPFKQHPVCFGCGGKFSVFWRACHCRNCGVCICSSCSTTWRKVSMPETYNIKNESNVKVCKSCTMLSNKFQRALLEGNCEDAQLIYNTGNINLRCPFMNSIKGCEAMFPIHCAAEGGDLMLLAWLVDVHFCPIKRIRTGNKINSQGSDELITTSRGRTIVEIAMANQRVDILRYLVNEKNLSVCGVKDLQTSLAALEAVLKAYPQFQNDDDENEQTRNLQEIHTLLPPHERHQSNHISNGFPSYSISGSNDDGESTDSARDSVQDIDNEDDQSVATTVPDACIICYANSIDCVITPCGHQICCLQCSTNLSTCPVCNVDCGFIRIFRP